MEVEGAVKVPVSGEGWILWLRRFLGVLWMGGGGGAMEKGGGDGDGDGEW